MEGKCYTCRQMFAKLQLLQGDQQITKHITKCSTINGRTVHSVWSQGTVQFRVQQSMFMGAINAEWSMHLGPDNLPATIAYSHHYSLNMQLTIRMRRNSPETFSCLLATQLVLLRNFQAHLLKRFLRGFYIKITFCIIFLPILRVLPYIPHLLIPIMIFFFNFSSYHVFKILIQSELI